MTQKLLEQGRALTEQGRAMVRLGMAQGAERGKEALADARAALQEKPGQVGLAVGVGVGVLLGAVLARLSDRR